MNLKTIKENIVSLNLVLMLMGYEFATCLFMPLVGGFEVENTQIVTIPYRAFALGITLLSIGIGIQRWQKSPRFNANVVFLLLFFFLYAIRMLYDNSNGLNPSPSQHYIFFFVIQIPYAISMMLTYDSINYKKVLYTAIILGTISVFLSFVFAKEDLSEESRMEGNAALNTISYGYLGLSVFVLALYSIIRLNFNKFIKICLLIILALAFFTTLRAGSRGPMVTLICIGGFWFASYYKNLFIAIFPTVITLALLVLFREQILDLVHSISPVAANRFQSLLGGNSSGRDVMYIDTLIAVSQSPITGTGYCNPGGGYPHNIILDGLIAFGVFGGIAMAILLYNTGMLAYKAMVLNLENAWIGILTIQAIVGHMFSGTFPGAFKTSGLIMLCFLLYSDVYIRKNNRQNQHLDPRQNFRRDFRDDNFPRNFRRNNPYY